MLIGHIYDLETTFSFKLNILPSFEFKIEKKTYFFLVERKSRIEHNKKKNLSLVTNRKKNCKSNT